MIATDPITFVGGETANSVVIDKNCGQAILPRIGQSTE